VVLLSGTHLQDNIAHLLLIARIDMVEEVTVTGNLIKNTHFSLIKV